MDKHPLLQRLDEIRDYTKVYWNKTSKDNLPAHNQRVLYYRPTKLTKVGEMIYLNSDKEHFLEEIPYWAKELTKPE